MSANRAGLAVAVMILAIFATACGDDSEPAAPPAATVTMTEYAFDPADLTVPRDARVEVVNAGQEVHTWLIGGTGRGTPDVQPGSRAVLSLEGLAPGRYNVFCDQPGHAERGQVGTLTIT